MELNLVMLGPPGAGKGTQARQLRRKWNIPHISTGAMLREAVQAATPLGREVAVIMENGGLISDEVITRVVVDRLSHPDTGGGFLLDGYPPTIAQAQSLDRMVSERAPLIIVDIALSEAEVVRRLASRMVCAECGANAVREGPACHDCGGPLVPRADDREQVVLNRLKVYRDQTEPLISYYGDLPTYCRIDGARLPDDVTAEIIHAVESRVRGIGNQG